MNFQIFLSGNQNNFNFVQGGSGIDRVAAADVAAQAAFKRLYAHEEPKTTAGQKKIQMIVCILHLRFSLWN